MASRTKKIDELLAALEQTGGDPLRLDALRRTQRFKRSWVELAEVLVDVRNSGSYRDWGYDDFHRYCTGELQLKKATVDKLTVSYSTLRQHAPQVLKWDGVAREIPSYQAVDYFSRAVESSSDTSDGPRPSARSTKPEVVDELRAAVFQEGRTLGELRKRFDPLLYPKPRGAKKLETIQQASRLALRLAELLPDIDDLSEKRIQQVETALGALRNELEALAEPLREKAAKARRRKAPPRATAEAS